MTVSARDRSGGFYRRALVGAWATAISAVVAFAAATAASATTYTVREHTVFGTVPVSTLSEVVGVSAGGGCPGGEESSCGDFNLARLGSGTVKAWGYNGSGQLGNGTSNSSTEPVAVTGLSGVTATAAGWSHSLALLSNGTVKAWGYGGNGGLGQGSFTSSDVPVTVSGLNGVAAVAGGAGDSLALLRSGEVMAWGTTKRAR